MKTSDRATAAVIYALLAALSLATLVILLMPPPALSWSLITSTPGAILTLGTLVSLSIVSASLAAFLWRPPLLPGRVLKILALFLPVLAVGWNFVAPIFWLVPIFFVWRATALP